ncbi:hypothetical protein LXL04_034296 [Taraxacum kok-saghyz]
MNCLGRMKHPSSISWVYEASSSHTGRMKLPSSISWAYEASSPHMGRMKLPSTISWAYEASIPHMGRYLFHGGAYERYQEVPWAHERYPEVPWVYEASIKDLAKVISNTSKVDQTFVDLISNVVNYTTIESNELGKIIRKIRSSVKIQTMRGHTRNVTLVGKFADKVLDVVKTNPSERHVIIYFHRCMLSSIEGKHRFSSILDKSKLFINSHPKVIEVFKKRFHRSMDIYLKILLYIKNQPPTSNGAMMKVAYQLNKLMYQRSFEKIDDFEEVLGYIAKRLHKVNIDDEK